MDRRSLREALRLMEKHQPFVTATVVHSVGSVPGKIGAVMIARCDGSFFGTVGGAALEERVKELCGLALASRDSGVHHFDLARWRSGGLPSLCGGTVDIAIQYVPARPNILLWGGGHVTHALSKILPTLEYDFSVADDRPDWVGPSRFPDADRREIVAAERVWQTFEPESFTHLYLLGYDAAKDLELLARSVEEFPNFIGLIASQSKKEHMFAELRKQGTREEALRRIRVPVGLSIGAETPAEIAVAIVAELIQGMRSSANLAPRPPSAERIRIDHVERTSP